MCDFGRAQMKLIFQIAVGIVLSEVIKSSAGIVILPFLVSFVLAKIIRPLGVKLATRFGVSEKLFCVILAVFVCLTAVFGIFKMSKGLVLLISMLGKDGNIGGIERAISGVSSSVSGIADYFTRLIDKLPFHLFGEAEEVRGKLGEYIAELLRYTATETATFVAGFTADFAKSLPEFLLSVFISAVSFIYLMADMDGIGKSIAALLSEDKRGKAMKVFREASDATLECVRAYLGLGAVTFGILFAGFLILKIPSAVIKAFVISIVDALPVLGCGVVLVPWGIVKLIMGETFTGIGLLVLCAVNWGTRQILEPRFLGRMTGTNPFLMLTAIYIGWKIAGVCGMIILSVAVMTATGRKRADHG